MARPLRRLRPAAPGRHRHHRLALPAPPGRPRGTLHQPAPGDLEAPWTLSPSATDPDIALEWLDRTAAGLEGLCFKRLTEPYRPTARTWQKYKIRETHDAIVGAVTGPTAAPRSLLLGHYDTTGQLQYIGRTTTLTQPAARTVGSHPARPRPSPRTRGTDGLSPPTGAPARSWT